jgi:hypothetical protein
MDWMTVVSSSAVGGSASPTTTRPVVDCTDDRIRSGYLGWLYGSERGCRKVGARNAGMIRAARIMRILKKLVFDRVFDRVRS